jgi:hypothetical protein
MVYHKCRVVGSTCLGRDQCKKGTGMKLIRRLDSKEDRQFWRSLERAVAAAKKEWTARLKKEAREWNARFSSMN